MMGVEEDGMWFYYVLQEWDLGLVEGGGKIEMFWDTLSNDFFFKIKFRLVLFNKNLIY